MKCSSITIIMSGCISSPSILRMEYGIDITRRECGTPFHKASVDTRTILSWRGKGVWNGSDSASDERDPRHRGRRATGFCDRFAGPRQCHRVHDRRQCVRQGPSWRARGAFHVQRTGKPRDDHDRGARGEGRADSGRPASPVRTAFRGDVCCGRRCEPPRILRKKRQTGLTVWRTAVTLVITTGSCLQWAAWPWLKRYYREGAAVRTHRSGTLLQCGVPSRRELYACQRRNH